MKALLKFSPHEAREVNLDNIPRPGENVDYEGVRFVVTAVSHSVGGGGSGVRMIVDLARVGNGAVDWNPTVFESARYVTSGRMLYPVRSPLPPRMPRPAAPPPPQDQT